MTPSRGLPAAPKDRATSLAELARADAAKGNLASAETNYRLALSFSPGNKELAAELKGVVEAREKTRKASSPMIR
jgi:Flp pilus assembly protein TadD